MSIKATGQFTIIDFNDAITLSGFLTANHPRTQIYTPDSGTYAPDWSVSPYLVVTPTLFVIGEGNDIMSDAALFARVLNIDWYWSNNMSTPIPNGGNYEIKSTVAPHIKVKANELISISSRDLVCKLTYKDPTTGLELDYVMAINFSKVSSGGGLVDAVAWAPNGNVFKNDAINELTAHIQLWRGSVVDTTGVSYQWYRKDTAIVDDQGGGIGWRPLNAGMNVSGWSGATLTISKAAVASVEVFKGIITDTDSSSPTHNQKFADQVVFYDQSDILQVIISSTGGSVFKNGQGATTLKAELHRAGVVIDNAGTAYRYEWYKYDKDGNLVLNWGGATNYQLGKTIDLDTDDVTIKATFRVEIKTLV